MSDSDDYADDYSMEEESEEPSDDDDYGFDNSDAYATQRKVVAKQLGVSWCPLQQ